MTIVTASRGVEEIGETTDYTLTFTPDHRIPDGEEIRVVFPTEQVTYDSDTTCEDGSGNDLSCTITDIDSSSFYV